MNTQLALMAVYEANDIPLETICEKYLGLNKRNITQR